MTTKINCIQNDKYPIQDCTFLQELQIRIQSNAFIKTLIWSSNIFTFLIQIAPLKTGCATIGCALMIARSSLLSNIAKKTFATTTVFFGLGILYSLALESLQYSHSKREQKRRLQAFAKLQNIPDSTRKKMDSVREFIQLRRPFLGQSYQNHQFYHLVTDITLAIKDDEKTASIWKKVLNTLDGMQVYYPDKTKHTLRFSETSITQQLFQGIPFKIKTEVLDPDHPEFLYDLKQIAAISWDCFGNHSSIDYSPTIAFWLKKWKLLSSIRYITPLFFRFVVARDASSHKILGFIHFIDKQRDPAWPNPLNKPEPLMIAGVGRDPGAVRMGVGKFMFDKLMDRMPRHAVAELEARESNADAIALYRKTGFQDVGTQEKFYHNPDESCLHMKFKKQA